MSICFLLLASDNNTVKFFVKCSMMQNFTNQVTYVFAYTFYQFPTSFFLLSEVLPVFVSGTV